MQKPRYKIKGDIFGSAYVLNNFKATKLLSSFMSEDQTLGGVNQRV